jgi:hypothetical protein
LAYASLALPAALLAGCGGGAQDYGGLSRSLGGDIGNSYGGSLAGRYGGKDASGNPVNALERGAYPKIETSFELSNLPGDPFDYEKVNVQVTLRKPDGGTVQVPAFFDGGKTWRMRFTPTRPGTYAFVEVKLNKETAHEQKLEKKEWAVKGDPKPGFVRLDPGDHNRFVFDTGERYLPLGHNQAWHNKGLPEIPEMFGKMHTAGENWSRVWMTHFDDLNLDWPNTPRSETGKTDATRADAAKTDSVKSEAAKPEKVGGIDLEVAKRWDAIVEGAEKNDIYFQMVLQHHGQYSSASGYKYSHNVNPNWEQNPYNVKNGGFLKSPEDFFTDPQARMLTKRKLYYIVARWGYSPNILAYELFNEVEFTDAAQGKLWEDIAHWHREMALFLRQFDGNRHLLTTSSAPSIAADSPIWETVDYVQTHSYPTDLLTTLLTPEATTGKKKTDKPEFVGEFGPKDLKDDGSALHLGIWAGLMSGHAGVPEYWDWDAVEKQNLYTHYAAMSGFLTESGFANKGGLATLNPTVETTQRAALRFAPGGGFGAATQNEFVVGESGVPAGMDRFPTFIQGKTHADMMPKPLTLQVSYAQAGTFTVSVAQVAKSGAHVVVIVDGKTTERDFPAAAEDYDPKAAESTVTVEVPAGAHTITVQNTGKDWFVVRQFALSNYTPALAAQARVGKDFAAVWVYNRATVDAPLAQTKETTGISGRVQLIGLQNGKYRATWWDTYAGKALDTMDVSVANAKDGVTLSTPPVGRDVALYVVRAGTPPAGRKGKGKGSKSGIATGAASAQSGATVSTASALQAAPVNK